MITDEEPRDGTARRVRDRRRHAGGLRGRQLPAYALNMIGGSELKVVRSLRVFTVLFGEVSPVALKQVAGATGGQVFDARNTQLSEVFKEIRGYQ